MILVSNHLLSLVSFIMPKDAVVRVNMAHVKDYDALVKAVDVKYDIFLDYPRNRTKPPVPKMGTTEMGKVINKYQSIKYLAVSNIETRADVDKWSWMLPERVSFVPKIETRKGVENLGFICKSDKVKYVMLDSEDLYTDVGNDAITYTRLKNLVKYTCRVTNVELLQLYGVVFA